MNSNSPGSNQERSRRTTPAVDAGLVSHLHVNAPLIPAVWRAPDAFSVLRLESDCGMADRITKLASAPALLVSVSIRSLPISDYQLWVDDKLVPTPFIPAFRSNVVNLDAKPQCWAGSAFDYVHYHVPRKALDDIAVDFAVGSVEGQALQISRPSPERFARSSASAQDDGDEIIFAPTVYGRHKTADYPQPNSGH
jgi:hypothetical protein